MGYAYYINEEYSVAVVRPTGRFDETEFIEALRTIYSETARTSTFAHVWDARSIDELTMDTDVISLYKSFLKENESRVRAVQVAVIAARSTTRLFSSMLRGINQQVANQSVRILHTEKTVAEWLGIPADVLEDIPDEAWMEPEN